MRFGGPRHGDGVAVVLQAVAGLVLDGSPGRLLAHPRLDPPPWTMKPSMTRWNTVLE